MFPARRRRNLTLTAPPASVITRSNANRAAAQHRRGHGGGGGYHMAYYAAPAAPRCGRSWPAAPVIPHQTSARGGFGSFRSRDARGRVASSTLKRRRARIGAPRSSARPRFSRPGHRAILVEAVRLFPPPRSTGSRKPPLLASAVSRSGRLRSRPAISAASTSLRSSGNGSPGHGCRDPDHGRFDSLCRRQAAEDARIQRRY